MIISIAILALNAILCSIWAQSVDTFLISNAVIMAVIVYSILNGRKDKEQLGNLKTKECEPEANMKH